jgi:hypothetical protein
LYMLRIVQSIVVSRWFKLRESCGTVQVVVVLSRWRF